MKRMSGYLRTLYQYVKTPKGRHDIGDYLYAGGAFFLITTLLLMILWIAR